MKRILFVILAVTLVFGAVGCGNKKTDNTDKIANDGKKELADAGKLSKSATEIYSDIQKLDGVAMPDMMDLDDEFINNYYGIDVSKFKDYFFTQATVSIQVDTVLIAEVKDKNDLKDMQESIQKILDAKANEMKDYLVDKYEVVKKASVKTKGNVIYLVISEQAAEIEKVIEDNIA